MDSFSVTDIYRKILGTALKSLRKGRVNAHAHRTEKQRFKYKRKTLGSVTRGLLPPNDGERRESAKEQTQTQRRRILQRVASKAASCPARCSLPLALEVSQEGCLQSHSLRVANQLNTRVLPLRRRPRTQAAPHPQPQPPSAQGPTPAGDLRLEGPRREAALCGLDREP